MSSPDLPANGTKTKRSWRTLVFYTLLFAPVFGALAVWFFCIYAPPLRVSVETTRYTEPLTADGQVDFARVYERLVTPPDIDGDANGFRELTRIFGDIENLVREYPPQERGEALRRQKYEKLGLDPNVPPIMDFPKNTHASLFEKSRERLEKPWTTELQILSDWVTTVDPALDAAAETIRKPFFFIPILLEPRPDCPMFQLTAFPGFSSFRNLVQCFQNRALIRIMTGNIDGAIDDCITLHRFGRSLEMHGGLNHRLVGIAIDTIGFSLPLGANPD